MLSKIIYPYTVIVYSIIKSHFKTGDQLLFIQKYIFLKKKKTITTFEEPISYWLLQNLSF